MPLKARPTRVTAFRSPHWPASRCRYCALPKRQLRELEQRSAIDPLQPDLFATLERKHQALRSDRPAVAALGSINPDTLSPREALRACVRSQGHALMRVKWALLLACSCPGTSVHAERWTFGDLTSPIPTGNAKELPLMLESMATQRWC